MRRRRFLAVLAWLAGPLLAAGAAEYAYRGALRWSCSGAPSPRDFELWVVGDSTPAGVVYGPRWSFPELVSRAFDGRLAGRPIAVRNLALPGTLLIQQDHRLRRELACRDARRPGALLVYAGHNDRHERARWPALTTIRQTLLRRSALLDALLFQAERARLLPSLRNRYTYEHHLRSILDAAERAGLRPVLGVPVGNVADIDPGVDVGGPSEREIVAAGSALERAGRWREAAEHYEAPRPVSTELSHYLAYRAGRCRRRLGQRLEANRLFWRAIDHGGNLRFGRAASWQHEVLRRLARERGLPLVESVELFLRASPDGMIGENLFVDGHHPNLRGTALLADAYAEALSGSFGEPVKRRFAGTLDEDAVGRRAAVSGLLYAGRWLLNVSVGHPFPQDRLALAERRFRRAAELDPGSFTAWMGLAVVAAGRASDLLASGENAAWLDRYPNAWSREFEVPPDELPRVIAELRRRGAPEPLLERMRRAHRWPPAR